MTFNNPIRLGVSVLGLLGCAVAPAACDHGTDIVTPVPLPSQITECETHTARVCGTWSLVAGTRTYNAVWSQGSKATITVVQFDSKTIVFDRVDNAGPTPDMNAHYVGIPSGAAVNSGTVQWKNDGLTISGIWDASW